MREILFRGKADGKWLYGALIPASISIMGEPHIIWSMDPTIQSDSSDGVVFGDSVVPATVGQYTGLVDRKGNKIFEGDIVKTTKYGVCDGNGHNFNGPDIFRVEFEDATFRLQNKWRLFNLRPDVSAEVVGNIHDNPELLGGGEK